MKKLLLILPLLALCLPAQVQLNNSRLSNFQVTATGGGGGSELTFGTVLTLSPITLNNYDGELGFEFTANANITVTKLGRYILSGNNQSHVLKIYAASGCSLLGSVSVNASGAPTDDFLYGTLSSPVSIVNGSSYYVMSVEVSGGDTWYQSTGGSGTTLTTTGDGTLIGSSYVCGTMADAGVTYVPVNFKYTKP